MKNNLTALKMTYEEIKIQQERIKNILNSLEIESKDMKLTDILNKLKQGESNNEVSLKLIDELTGAQNRITIANRRYAQNYRYFMENLGPLQKMFLDKNELPPAPEESGNLKTTK